MEKSISDIMCTYSIVHTMDKFRLGASFWEPALIHSRLYVDCEHQGVGEGVITLGAWNLALIGRAGQAAVKSLFALRLGFGEGFASPTMAGTL